MLLFIERPSSTLSTLSAGFNTSHVTLYLEAEDNRQNRRIEILENSVQQLQELVTSVQTLANNMENMVKEQGQQSARLEALESREGEKWRTVTSYLLTAILGIAVGIIAKQFGI